MTTDSGKVLKSLGKINSYYALKTYGVNAQPYYVLQGRDGKTLVPPRGYDLNVEKLRAVPAQRHRSLQEAAITRIYV